jgi:hypothetical protein
VSLDASSASRSLSNERAQLSVNASEVAQRCELGGTRHDGTYCGAPTDQLQASASRRRRRNTHTMLRPYSDRCSCNEPCTWLRDFDTQFFVLPPPGGHPIEMSRWMCHNWLCVHCYPHGARHDCSRSVPCQPLYLECRNGFFAGRGGGGVCFMHTTWPRLAS